MARKSIDEIGCTRAIVKDITGLTLHDAAISIGHSWMDG